MPARSSRRKPGRRLAGTTEAAGYAGLCTRTIYRYIADGRLTGYRIGPKLIKVDLDELDRIITPIPAAG
jgi:excisionase family DNA binding protein